MYYLYMEDKITYVFTMLKKLPIWARVLVVFLIAIILSVFLATSCASTQRIRISIKDTPSGVSITTSQSADSSGTTLNLNPVINLQKL